jgi:hypothetical protein
LRTVDYAWHFTGPQVRLWHEQAVELLTRRHYDETMSNNLLPTAASDPKWAATWLELGQGAPTLAQGRSVFEYAQEFEQIPGAGGVVA